MAYYRLYFFDGSGSIEHFREFELHHDLLAVQQAAEWRVNQRMELWTGTRMVKCWDDRTYWPTAQASDFACDAGPAQAHG